MAEVDIYFVVYPLPRHGRMQNHKKPIPLPSLHT